VVIPDPDVPHGDNPDTPSIPDTPTEIPDEPTPHAEAPKTGDNNSLWLFIALASGIGIVALNLGGRKRKEDDKQ
jgi:LPXTG-motif cell wall-anchored protein